MQKTKKILGILLSLSTLMTSCSNSQDEINEKYNSIEKRYSMFMTFEGCLKNITEQNSDDNSRESQLKIVSSILPETFKFLNQEMEYLKSIGINEENKDIIEKYSSKIGSLNSEHIRIFRLVFVELSKKKADYWGKLSLEGANYDVLKQVYENKTQKSVINMEINNLTLMRFKNVIMVSPANISEELKITSPSDSELIPMKM